MKHRVILEFEDTENIDIFVPKEGVEGPGELAVILEQAFIAAIIASEKKETAILRAVAESPTYMLRILDDIRLNNAKIQIHIISEDRNHTN